MVTDEIQVSCLACNQRITDFNNITLEELEHIASCDSCAIQYADYLEQKDIIKAPHYLKHDILLASGALSENLQEKMQYILPISWKNIQLFCYSMKIGLAICGALAILFLTPYRTTFRAEPYGVVAFLDKMNSELKEFSNNMADHTEHLVTNSSNNKEDFLHDKKKE